MRSKHDAHFTGLHVAAEALRAIDHAFPSNTNTPDGASVGSLDDVRSWSAEAAGGNRTLAHRGCAPAPVTAPIREQCHGQTDEGVHTPRDGQASSARGVDDPRVAPQLSILPLRNLQFTLPMPPSCNALYGIGPKGQKYLLPEQRQFRSAVIAIVHRDMRMSEQRGQPLAGRIEISTTYFFNDRRRTDIRNRVKALDDALEHAGAFANDCQIDAGHDYRVIEAGDERCEVRLRELSA